MTCLSNSNSIISTYESGHTEEKHVSISKRKLRNRIYCTPVSSTTSYSTEDSAKQTIQTILKKSEKKIQKWITSDTSEKIVLYGTMQKSIGYGYFRTEDEKIVFKEELNKACVILKKEEEDIQVLTSYLVL